MKIIQIATALSWRGGEQQVAYLIEELSKLKVEQLVICSKGSEMEKYCIQAGQEYVSLSKKSSFDLFFATNIKKITKQFGADIIHVHDAHAHTLAILSAVIFGNKANIVLSRRVDFPVKDNWFSKFKYNHPAIKKIVCVSNMIMKITGESIKDKSVLTTVYSGIDLRKFKKKQRKLRTEFSISEDTKIIGNTSAIADHKDYYTFVDTAEILLKIRQDIIFLIIGDGPDRSAIESYVSKKQLTKHILFTGFRNDITDILPELDLFLMTSKTEGLGTSLLDALACEVPIVATRAGGIPEVIEHEKTGLLAEIKSSNQLAEQVNRILNTQELRKDLVTNGLKKVSLFSKTQTAKSTLEIYTKVLA